MSERMSDQELMTGVSTKPHKRILAAMNMLERASSPEGLISAAADTYPYVKAAIITAVRKDANKIAELEALVANLSESLTGCNENNRKFAKEFRKYTALEDGLLGLKRYNSGAFGEAPSGEFADVDGEFIYADELLALIDKESTPPPATDDGDSSAGGVGSDSRYNPLFGPG